MVNTKLSGMFELIHHWGPANHTIKSTILKDIQHIQHEMTLLNTKEKTRNFRNIKQRCRNGNSCWYLKQGKCWFAHDETDENCNTILGTQATQQSRATTTTPNGKSKRTNKQSNAKHNRKEKKQKNKKDNKSNTSDEFNNRKRKKKKTIRRKRKKKKVIDLVSQTTYDGNNISPISPVAELSPEPNEIDIANQEYSQTPNQEIDQPLVPCLYKFDTMDSIDSIINEQDLLNQMDFFTDTNEKLFALLQIRNLCDCAVESEWTLRETMKEVNEMIENFNSFKMT